ncbi:hypothetical protein FSARC_4073 [Fusarium sarcochroum]|uniref:Uncharacterized protein n=1 Tax=Fusarium sarcochroum TaxID=1208366 RepID=A0A8H4U300_9HYPO|nr:hypothetical protein FSARC_4073 [Fusarium sarcochroum]
MPSLPVVDYFRSLKRCNLVEVNDELRRSCLSEAQLFKFREDGIIVIENVFTEVEILKALSAFHSLEELVRNDDTSYADINLEATGGGWKGQQGAKVSHF